MFDCVSALCKREAIIYFLTGIAWPGAPLSKKMYFCSAGNKIGSLVYLRFPDTGQLLVHELGSKVVNFWP